MAYGIAADMAKDMKPGQFVNIKIDGFMLRRPISISSVEDHKFVIVYKVVGDGTRIINDACQSLSRCFLDLWEAAIHFMRKKMKS